MKKYIWINGKDVVLFNAKDMDTAITTVTNLSDHSKEVIVREYESLSNNLSFEDDNVRVLRRALKSLMEAEGGEAGDTAAQRKAWCRATSALIKTKS